MDPHASTVVEHVVIDLGEDVSG